MNLREVYNQLFAGKKLRIAFSSEAEASNFRVRMHQFKNRQESQMIATGMLEKEEVQMFTFSKSEQLRDGSILATMHFQDKQPSKDYRVTIIDEKDGDCET